MTGVGERRAGGDEQEGYAAAARLENRRNEPPRRPPPATRREAAAVAEKERETGEGIRDRRFYMYTIIKVPYYFYTTENSKSSFAPSKKFFFPYVPLSSSYVHLPSCDMWVH